MLMTAAQVAELAGRVGSPFYLCHGDRFEDNCRRIAAAFREHWQPVELAYSYKTNYAPLFCRIVQSLGATAEVVSRMEWDLALRLGQDPTQIIFNGPVKALEDYRCALDRGTRVNLDSFYELGLLQTVVEEQGTGDVEIGLRINIDLGDQGGASAVQERIGVSRFGFAAGMLEEVRRSLGRMAGVQVVALHGHLSTVDREPGFYRRIAETLCRIAERWWPESVRQINIGGGFFGEIPPEMAWRTTPGFSEYGSAVGEMLQGSRWAQERRPTLVIEPGLAVVANAVSFFTRVVGLKHIEGRRLVTVDGSVMHIKPSLHKRNMPWRLVGEGGEEGRYDVVGSTCMEKDYLLSDIQGPLPGVGDYLEIRQAGAYTISMSPHFISYAPGIVGHWRGEWSVERERQDLEGLLHHFNVPGRSL